MSPQEAVPTAPDLVPELVMDANRQQAEQWNGDGGRRWILHQERLDLLMQPFLHAALEAAAVRPGEQVLDVGCGCGASTLAIADAVGPHGRVVGLDVSLPMLGRARSRAADTASTARFIHADAAAYRFPADGYDLLFSRFGVMFFGDPVAAFGNLRQAMKPDGRAVFICWRSPPENDWLRLPREISAPFLPPLPPEEPFAPGPFAFADPGRVSGVLADAGWSASHFARFDHRVRLGEGLHDDPAEDALADLLRVSPLAQRLEGQPDDVQARVRDAVRQELRRHVDAGAVTLSAAGWIVSVTA